MVVAEISERLAVNKQAARKFDVESLVSWRLGNGIRLRPQTGVQLCRTQTIART